MHEIWSFDSREENLDICCHKMSDFKAKMHQIQFRLGLFSRPHGKGCGMGELEGRGAEGRKGKGSGGEERRGRELPMVGSHPMFEILKRLKNTLGL